MRIFNDILGDLMEFMPSGSRRKGTQGRESQIMKRVLKDKNVTIDNPTSQRYYYRGNDGTFSGNPQTGVIENEGYGVGVGRPSTAVKTINYDPNTQVCRITFVGGSKEYEYKMTKGEFDNFLNASSKGRYVNKVMKYNNRMPGY